MFGLASWGAFGRQVVHSKSLQERRPVVTRGPYLQLGTMNSMMIRWRTNVASTSVVRIGTKPGALDNVVEQNASTTEHRVEVTNLQPRRKYYYSIGTNEKRLAGDDDEHYFMTAPIIHQRSPTRIWVIGDSGTGSDDARAVRNSYYQYAGNRHTDVWLLLGDNAYMYGTDREYQDCFFDIYPEMMRKTVAWPAFGNHDSYCDECNSFAQTGPFFDAFDVPRFGQVGGTTSQSKSYYSFDYANIHFVCLDSMGSSRKPDGPMLSWLESDLANTQQEWIIAYWHHAPYTKGSHDSDSNRVRNLPDMRQNAVPILERYGVDLVLSGHSHCYERSYLINGHYGKSDTLTDRMILDRGDGSLAGSGAYRKETLVPTPNQGAVYATVGCSGWVGEGKLNHPAMYKSIAQLGSLVLDVDGYRLSAAFLDKDGHIRDRFSIVKGKLTYFPIFYNRKSRQT
ncbi:metallophosphoesterase family protein [Chloroflexi bacterium TSY]|nr:metallophosphoesterase family protein [Chloroflexi bacterium TSY]